MSNQTVHVAELFAGVGGFRLALDGYHDERYPDFERQGAGPFQTVWANQWEPPGTPKRQFAWQCYTDRFGSGGCVNRDIHEVMDEVAAGSLSIPDVQMLVGGFPCQDYSVAKPLSKAHGIEGKKGVLWWDILRFLQLKKPRFLLLENVDRLLKSPVDQRGRDFAIILSCLAREGYSVEWRVINAADYGFPQKRKRVFIFGVRDEPEWDLRERLVSSGVLPRAFPVKQELTRCCEINIALDPYQTSQNFGIGEEVSVFQSAGVMQSGSCLTGKITPSYNGKYVHLRDIVVSDSQVPDQFFIPDEKVASWMKERKAKSIDRTAKTGFKYKYSEGNMPWPDSLDKAARTILTAEGGSGASRMKHAIRGDSGRFRRLIPDELDQIQTFPKGWTRGMSDGHRAFCMGNALVVGIPYKIGEQITAIYLESGTSE